MIALLVSLQDQALKTAFGERPGAGQTTLSGLGLAVLAVVIVATLVARRRRAWLPMLALIVLVPTSQRIVVATLDFTFIRILLLVACMRLAARGEYASFRLGRIDKLVFAWAVVSTAIYVGRTGTIGYIGNAFDFVGLYFFFRCLLRDWGDVERVISCLLILSGVVFFAYLSENTTHRNLFSVFGGVPEITVIRDGRWRLQGAFPHPILGGCFWGVLAPLAVARLWAKGARRNLAAVGLVSMLGIVFLSGSSTPLMSALAGLLGMAAFPLRRSMRTIRWGSLAVILMLHMIMEAPVWHLIGRVRVIGGSTGYHRYRLIDAAVRHFGDWWFAGVQSTAYWGRQLFDVTNQFIREGVRGGIWSLVLFVWVFGVALAGAGRLRRRARRGRFGRRREVLAWALGASLFAHLVMFIAVSITYSQQNVAVMFIVIAMIASLDSARAVAPKRSRAPMRPRQLTRQLAPVTSFASRSAPQLP